MNLAITILTGRRPELLRRTVESFARHEPELCAAAHVTVYVNGGDRPTSLLAQRLGWIDDLVIGEHAVLPIGAAVSLLMARVPDTAEYVLHLEDDWECLQPGAAAAAVAILRRQQGVRQVRLRRHVPPTVLAQRTLPYHLVTRRKIRWKELRTPEARYRVGDAHFTFNPSLVRRALLHQLYPCESERDAMAKFHRQGSRVAQLLPGAFRHIGDGDRSLRRRLGRG